MQIKSIQLPQNKKIEINLKTIKRQVGKALLLVKQKCAYASA